MEGTGLLRHPTYGKHCCIKFIARSMTSCQYLWWTCCSAHGQTRGLEFCPSWFVVYGVDFRPRCWARFHDVLHAWCAGVIKRLPGDFFFRVFGLATTVWFSMTSWSQCRRPLTTVAELEAHCWAGWIDGNSLWAGVPRPKSKEVSVQTGKRCEPRPIRPCRGSTSDWQDDVGRGPVSPGQGLRKPAVCGRFVEIEVFLLFFVSRPRVYGQNLNLCTLEGGVYRMEQYFKKTRSM